MVFLTRSVCRWARSPATSRSLFTAAAATRPTPSIVSRGAQALRYNNIGKVRMLTGKREKVKVLLVLYDGKKHAEEVRNLNPALSLVAN